jgi:hypothetical protein
MIPVSSLRMQQSFAVLCYEISAKNAPMPYLNSVYRFIFLRQWAQGSLHAFDNTVSACSKITVISKVLIILGGDKNEAEDCHLR